MKRQQKEAEKRCFKIEEARCKEEFAAEEKRRKEEREHEIFMMQMMGRMFMQAATALNSPSPKPQTQAGAYYAQTGGINTFMYTRNNQSDSFDVIMKNHIKHMYVIHIIWNLMFLEFLLAGCEYVMNLQNICYKGKIC